MYQQLKDPETGCIAYGRENLEQCKQTYYLKQQNEILSQQQTVSNQQQENLELKAQVETMRQEIETLKSQQVVQQPPAQTNSNLLAASIAGVTLPNLLIIIAVIVSAAILIWRKFKTKDEYQVHFFRKTPQYPPKSNQWTSQSK